jgi:hypothetical protein
MCKARVALYCPSCKRKLEITRPDSQHPLWSLVKPKSEEIDGDVITQVVTCKNSDCSADVTIFWFEAKLD